jgi:hypothetical protein
MVSCHKSTGNHPRAQAWATACPAAASTARSTSLGCEPSSPRCGTFAQSIGADASPLAWACPAANTLAVSSCMLRRGSAPQGPNP